MVVTPDLLSLTPRERARFLNARQRGYIVSRPREHPPGVTAYWRWCCLEHKPVITLAESLFSSRLELDLLPADRRLTPAGMQAVYETMTLACPPASVRIGPVTCVALRIEPRSDAPVIAGLLVEPLADPRWTAPVRKEPAYRGH